MRITVTLTPVRLPDTHLVVCNRGPPLRGTPSFGIPVIYTFSWANPAVYKPGRELGLVTEGQHAMALSAVVETQQADWNWIKKDFPARSFVHELISEQASRTPDAVALTKNGYELSYQELDSRSSAIAETLADIISPGEIVGVFFNRSPEMIVAILGVLKAGGAYLPLDPTHPDDRLQYMIEDASAGFIVGESALENRLAIPDDHYLTLEELSNGIKDGRFSCELTDFSSASHLAYVMYTSGSTGKPKGVQIYHQGLVNYVFDFVARADLGVGDRSMQFSSIGFDISVEEIFTTLISGATLVLKPNEGVLGPGEFNSWIQEEQISVISPPTALWHEWISGIDAIGTALPSNLRLAVIGGEKASVSVVEKWHRLANGRVRLWNTYGPTEASIAATIHEASPADETEEFSIGRPFANVTVYILDSEQQPLDTGEVGELYIGGVGVGAGYVNRPEQNAERFLTDPFAGPGSRMYRTGDLATLREDGNLYIQGRIDDQIKIGSFRVEPGEVEAALASFPRVTQAFVCGFQTPAGKKRLASYYITADGQDIAEEELRSYMAERVPEYAIPWSIMWMDRFPLTVNGKVDKRNLPTPTRRASSEITQTMSGSEQLVADIFAQILEVERVGAETDFFDMGGDSLLAMNLLVTLEKEFGVGIPLETLIKDSSVAGLAAAVTQQVAPEDWSPFVVLQSDGTKAPLFFVPEITGDAFRLRDLAEYFSTDQPLFALQAPGYHEGQVPYETVEGLAEFFVHRMLDEHPGDSYRLAGFCFGASVAYEMAQQLRAAGHEVAFLAVVEYEMMDSPYQHQSIKNPLVFTRALWNLPGWYREMSSFLGYTWAFRQLGARIGKYFGQVKEKKSDDEVELPPELQDVPEKHKQVWAAHERAMNGYLSKPYEGKLTVIQSKTRPAMHSLNPLRHWRELAAGEIEVHRVPGFHQRVLHKPNVEKLAEVLCRCLS